MTTPIFVTNFNNLERGFRCLVEWLWESKCDITVIDNDSSWPPLLDYYQVLFQSNVKVMRLKENLGPYAFWELNQHRMQTERFIVTDPDVVPAEGLCPDAPIVIGAMNTLMDRHGAGKVGPSLRIDNLPDHFKHKQDVLKWEQQFWNRLATYAPYSYEADIDTTFAMYEPGSEVRSAKPCLRLAPPYSFEHVSWYEDSAAPNAERDYYLAHIRKDWTDWSKR